MPSCGGGANQAAFGACACMRAQLRWRVPAASPALRMVGLIAGQQLTLDGWQPLRGPDEDTREAAVVVVVSLLWCCDGVPLWWWCGGGDGDGGVMSAMVAQWSCHGVSGFADFRISGFQDFGNS